MNWKGLKTIKTQIIIKKKFSKQLLLFIILTLFLVLVITYAVLTDIIILRKTEDMVGSENAISILFVGSSHVFVGNAPSQLQTITKMYDIEIIYKDISRHGNRGGTLNELREQAINEIQSGRFDYVVLQDQTRRSLSNVEGLLDEIRIICNEAKANSVIPVLYNFAWAVSDGLPDEKRLSVSTDVFKLAADENDAILVNAAEAWIYSYRKIPGISLYTRFDPRGLHANSAGGFLTACVFAATLFDLHIEEIPKDSLYRGNDASELAKAAWDFVRTP